MRIEWRVGERQRRGEDFEMRERRGRGAGEDVASRRFGMQMQRAFLLTEISGPRELISRESVTPDKSQRVIDSGFATLIF